VASVIVVIEACSGRAAASVVVVVEACQQETFAAAEDYPL
jgi:hypothetical protein